RPIPARCAACIRRGRARMPDPSLDHPPCALAFPRVACARPRRFADPDDELQYALQRPLQAAEILERDRERIRAVLRTPYRDLLADLFRQLKLEPARLKVDARAVVGVLRRRLEQGAHGLLDLAHGQPAALGLARHLDLPLPV